MSIRLNKLLANRGIASRRHCDALIAEGRVRVNGRTVIEAGTTVEEGRDRIEVDGKPLPGRQRLVYYVLNKPVGVITTMDDPQGRRTVRELLPRGARVYPVGRLDADTSGLLVLTNDGDLAHKLMHPRYGVVKVYRVRLDREPGRVQLERLARGVEFEPGVTSAPAVARRIDPGFDAIMIEVQIHEGRHRQVRRMCEAVGLTVTGLHRVGYGPIRLGPLARGMFRELSDEEIAQLQAAAARPRGGSRPGVPARPPRPVTPAAAAKAARQRIAQAPLKPAKPVKPQPPAPPEVEEDDAEFEETWVPGGGFTSELADDETADEKAPPVWPARADGRRGDAGFQGTPARDRAAAARDRSEPPRRKGAPPPRRNAPRGETAPARTEDLRGRIGGPRPRSSGPREGAGAPRERFGTARERAASARPRSGGPRPRPGAPRERFGAPRERDASPRPRFGDPRPSSSGPRLRPNTEPGRGESPRARRERFAPPRERFDSSDARSSGPRSRGGAGGGARGPRSRGGEGGGFRGTGAPRARAGQAGGFRREGGAGAGRPFGDRSARPRPGEGTRSGAGRPAAGRTGTSRPSARASGGPDGSFVRRGKGRGVSPERGGPTGSGARPARQGPPRRGPATGRQKPRDGGRGRQGR